MPVRQAVVKERYSMKVHSARLVPYSQLYLPEKKLPGTNDTAYLHRFKEMGLLLHFVYFLTRVINACALSLPLRDIILA
jgi:hypothetical protein